MCRAFTLLELMVVMGIMTFLGIASANSYNALRRGMEERSAVDAVSTFLRAAKERANIDRVQTAVFCWNRCVREADQTPGGDDAIVVGEAVAVRRNGRITWVAGNLLYDEFGDLNRSYDSDDDVGNLGKRKGFRLWHMHDDNAAQMQYSIVADGVYAGKATGTSFMPLADGAGSGVVTNCDIRAYAFLKVRSSGHDPTWLAGSAYGLEFQRLRLPDGYIFGRDNPPTKFGDLQEVRVISFIPGGSTVGEVDISSCRAGDDGNQQVAYYVGEASGKERLGDNER